MVSYALEGDKCVSCRFTNCLCIGTSFWDQPISNFMPAFLKAYTWNFPINEAFMIFGGVSLIGNIVTS